MATLESSLEEGISQLGLEASPGQIAQLSALSCLLERWGARVNLTGHRDAETIARRLVLGAAALLAQLPAFRSAADLGSGAGFPGLPFAILRPDLRLVLVESRQRRHHFQREAVRKLGLENVVPRLGRIEALEPEPVDLVVAQALARPDAAFELMDRWARSGGWLLIPGGEKPPEVAPRPGVEPRILHYDVPLDGPRQTAWLAHIASGNR